MAYIVTFERNALDQDQVLVRILDDSTGSYVEQTRLEIGYAQYNASVVGGLVSVTNKTTLEALFEAQPFDLYRRNTVPYNTWGFDAASSVSMLNLEIGGAATGASPPPVFMFSNFVAGGNTITPENTADTLTFTAGSGISIAGNITTDTITVSNTGIRGAFGTAPIQVGVDLSGNATVSIDAATTSAPGSMSAADKTKLDGIGTGATVVSVTGTAPIVSSGGANPAISITAATTSAAGSMSSADKTKLDGIAAGAEVNQNAFSNVAVSGQTTVAADTKTDTLTLVAGTNITLTTDAGTDSITITANGGGGSSYSTVRTQSGTSYTLALTDAGDYIQTTSTTAVTITVPLQSSVTWSADTEIYFEQNNTGQITIAGASGVTVNSSETLKSFARYSVLALKRVASDVWTLTGERALV